jgi:hypothetical protein
MNPPEVERLALGSRVLVRCRYDGHWASGFAVSALTVADNQTAVRVRRVSDGTEIPQPFDPHDVRAEEE